MELFLTFFRVRVFFSVLVLSKYFTQRRTQHNYPAKFIHSDLGSWTDLSCFTADYATPLVVTSDGSSTARSAALAPPSLLPLMSTPELLYVKLVFLFMAHIFQRDENSSKKAFKRRTSLHISSSFTM